ncbi:24479_t:CDS:1, partial [Gigaspora rosea]
GENYRQNEWNLNELENLSEETDDFVSNSIDNQRTRQHNTSLHYTDSVSSVTSENSDLN